MNSHGYIMLSVTGYALLLKKQEKQKTIIKIIWKILIMNCYKLLTDYKLTCNIQIMKLRVA